MTHSREGEIDEELAGARNGQESAKNAEHDDDGGGDIDGYTEYPFQCHVHVSDDALHIVAPVSPGSGERRPDICITDEDETADGHDPAR